MTTIHTLSAISSEPGASLLDGEALTEDQAGLEALFYDLFGSDELPATQCPQRTGNVPVLSDTEIIDHAHNARNGSKFKALWNGSTGGYPSPSEADSALAMLLAFWTKDEEQIERIMRRTGLERAKWDERRGRTTWIGQTISRAGRQVGTRYTPGGGPNNYSATLKYKVPAERIEAGPQGGPQRDSTGQPDNEPDVSAGTMGASAEAKAEAKAGTMGDIFVTARDVAESTPEQPTWAAHPWVVLGGVTELDGPIKGGKTTWQLAMCRSILDGAEFMGCPTHKGPVVYLSEQPPASFREALRRADLLERDDFYILFWSKASHLSWLQTVGIAVDKALEVGATLLVVDTLGWWAGLRGDEENSAGAAQTAMEPLLATAGNHPLGVLVVRHDRKSGGEVGQSARGSSAFGGSVDIVLALKRPEGNPGASLNMRVIHSLSRFDETPAELMVELTDQGYVSHGDVYAVAHATARTAVEDALKAGKPNADGQATYELTLDELIAACEDKSVRRSTLQDVLSELCRQFLVKKVGAGKRGDPHRFTWIGD